MYHELLLKVQELIKEEEQKHEDKGDTSLRKSGFVLEHRHDLIHKDEKRISTPHKKSDFDFMRDDVFIDVKAYKGYYYNDDFFIEAIGNKFIGSIPAYLEPRNKDKRIELCFTDIYIGRELRIRDTHKFINKIKHLPMIDGGYWARGWRVSPYEYPDLIEIDDSYCVPPPKKLTLKERYQQYLNIIKARTENASKKAQTTEEDSCNG
jgi:hypothetical protein